jgi:hypothetical protein
MEKAPSEIASWWNRCDNAMSGGYDEGIAKWSTWTEHQKYSAGGDVFPGSAA